MSDALLVIDVQQALVDELPAPRRSEFLERLGALLDGARDAGVPVVYVRHDGSPQELVPGTPGWEIAEAIAPRPGEPIVEKRFGDAFVETNLSDVLSALQADHLIASGMQTDHCVAATVRGAGQRGYRVTLVEDAHATYDWDGKSEAQIRDEMQREAVERGVRLVSAADAFA